MLRKNKKTKGISQRECPFLFIKVQLLISKNTIGFSIIINLLDKNNTAAVTLRLLITPNAVLYCLANSP
jgi:hypothetical protein